MQPALRRTPHATRSSARRLELRARRGVSLMLVAVTLSVVAVMAAVTMPNLVTYQKQKDAEFMAKNILSLDSSLDSWLRITGQLPQTLHILVLPPTTTDLTCGGHNISSKAVGQWSNASFWPWSGMTIIPGAGVPTPIGFIHDSVLNSTVATGDGELHIDSLDADAVQMLDIAVDGSDDPASGLLEYGASPTNSSLYLARFHVHVGRRGGGCT